MITRFRCHLCPGRPWTDVPVHAALNVARREQLAMGALERHYEREHRGRA